MKGICVSSEILSAIMDMPEDNCWRQILDAQKNIYIEAGNIPEKIENLLHKKGQAITKVKPSSFNGWIVIRDIEQIEAEKIMAEKGYCCVSVRSNTRIFLMSKGREHYQLPHKKGGEYNSWTKFFEKNNRVCSSILVIDRYLFEREWEKDLTFKYEIDTCIKNLGDILNNCMPNTFDGEFIVSVVFKSTYIIKKNGPEKEKEYFKFSELVSFVQQVRGHIKRDYPYTIEIIGLNNKCEYYNETHDRYVFTNYSVTDAPHKLVTFSNDQQSLCIQKLTFNYSYSCGLEDDECTTPDYTIKLVTEAIKTLVFDESNRSLIRYACNGKTFDFSPDLIKNELLQ